MKKIIISILLFITILVLIIVISYIEYNYPRWNKLSLYILATIVGYKFGTWVDKLK